MYGLSGPPGSSPVHYRARASVQSSTNGGGGETAAAVSSSSYYYHGQSSSSTTTTTATPQQSSYGYYHSHTTAGTPNLFPYGGSSSAEGARSVVVADLLGKDHGGLLARDNNDPGGVAAANPLVSFAANYRVAVLYLPTFGVIFSRPESAVPLKVFAVTMLVVYGLDLANLPVASGWVLWISCLVQTLLTIGYGLLWGSSSGGDDNGEDDDIDGMGPFETLMDSFLVGSFYICNACWLSLQSQHAIASNYAIPLESTLFGLLPLVFATMAVRLAAQYAPPYLPLWLAFTTALFLSMLLVGKSSYGNTYAIRRGVAKVHVIILVFAPAMCHVNTISMYDFVLAYTVPILLLLAAPLTTQSPYLQLRRRRDNHHPQWFPYAAALIGAMAFYHRYWIPLVHHWSLKILGAHDASAYLSTFLFVGTAAGLAAIWLWHRSNLLGEYHEDVIQILLAFAGVGLGKGSGLSWTMTPLPVLALLGMMLWATTRMLRYLAIVLFVVHAASIVVFTYKYVGIQKGLVLPWGHELTLVRFGTVVTILSILIGTAMGLSVRPAGGFMGQTLRQFDVLGLLLITYSILLAVLEVTLYRQRVPTRDLVGFMLEEDAVQSDEMLYSPYMAFFTSLLTLFLIIIEQRRNSLHLWTTSVVTSIALGKSLAFWIDATNDFQSSDPRGFKLLVRIALSTLLCAALLAPCAFLRPVHIKSSGRLRTSRQQQGLPQGSLQPIIIYCLLFLPLAIVAAIPDVLIPAVSTLLSNYRNDAYYLVSTPVSELVGGMISLWGLGSVIMLNHYLPDGGADVWKKVGALAFILGTGLMIAAPSIGLSFRPISHNPYASMSSLGSELMRRSISRTGGFGFLVAATATLLALSGPLQLSEKRHASGQRDKFLLFRSMVFSLMFGGGVAWFATIQNMGDAHLLLLIITMMTTLVMSFLGTITAVLGHFIEIQNFEEVVQFSQLWLIAFAVMLPVAGLPQLLPSSIRAHAFGAGGWCSTYLGISAVSSLGVAILLRMRSSRNVTTRGLANSATIASFACFAVTILGSFGIGGIETDDRVSRILHIPIAVCWILFVSPILLILEGESLSRRGPGRTNLQASTRTKGRLYGLSFPYLLSSNRWFPMFFGVLSVLLASSFYAIFYRGNKVFAFSTSRTSEMMTQLLKTALNAKSGPNEVYRLVNLVVEQTESQSMESHVDEASFWLSDNPIRPILHVAGLLSIFPSLFRLIETYWRRKQMSSSSILLPLPFAAATLLFCSLPTLRIASTLVTLLSLRQLWQRRNVESETQSTM